MGGSIFYGQSADGSDVKQWTGVFTNPDNDNEWSTEPYNKAQKEQEKSDSYWDYINSYLRRQNRSLFDEVDLILNKKSKLSRFYRDLIMTQADEEGLMFR